MAELSKISCVLAAAAFIAFPGCRTNPPPTAAPATQPVAVVAGPPALDQHIPDVNFNGIPLHQAIETIRKQTTAVIDVDWAALHTIGIEPTAPVTARARDIKVSKALGLIAKSVNGEEEEKQIAFMRSADGSEVRLTSRAEQLKTTVQRSYDIEDLIKRYPADHSAEGVVDITNYIMQNVDNPSWKEYGGDVGEIDSKSRPGFLIITQIEEDQVKIPQGIASFRQPPIESVPK